MNYLFTILFSITCTHICFTQSSNSTIDKLNSEFFKLYDQDLEKAFQTARQALNESRKVKYAAGEGGALYRIGIYYDIKMKSDSARVYLFKGIEKLKSTRAFADLGDAYNNLGAHYYYQFDYKNLSLSTDGYTETLTQKEADLLKLLNEHRNQVVKRSFILITIWGKDDYFLGRSLDVFISRLRKYLSLDDRIKVENIHGVGFKFRVDE